MGVQRQLGDNRAIEFRYIGNRSLRQWIVLNQNEVNIFENGFLTQFKAAQQNLAINQQNGITSFADNGFAGQQTLPVFDAAFAGESSGGTGVPLQDYGNNNFLNDLTTGQAGALAGVLSGVGGRVPYLCNLVGSSFGPCANNLGYTGERGISDQLLSGESVRQQVGLSQLVAKGLKLQCSSGRLPAALVARTAV